MTLEEIRALYYGANSTESAREAMDEIGEAIDLLQEQDAVQARGYMEGLALMVGSG